MLELHRIADHTVVLDVVVLLVDGDGAAVEFIIGSLRDNVQRALAVGEVAVGQGVKAGAGSGGVVLIATAIVPIARLIVHTGNIVILCVSGDLNVITIGVAVGGNRLGILVGIGGCSGLNRNIKGNAVGLGGTGSSTGTHIGGKLCRTDVGETCRKGEVAGAGGVGVGSIASTDTVDGRVGDRSNTTQGINGLIVVCAAVIILVNGSLRSGDKIAVAVVHGSAVLNSAKGRFEKRAVDIDCLSVSLALENGRDSNGRIAAADELHRCGVFSRRQARLSSSCNAGIAGSKRVRYTFGDRFAILNSENSRNTFHAIKSINGDRRRQNGKGVIASSNGDIRSRRAGHALFADSHGALYCIVACSCIGGNVPIAVSIGGDCCVRAIEPVVLNGEAGGREVGGCRQFDLAARKDFVNVGSNCNICIDNISIESNSDIFVLCVLAINSDFVCDGCVNAVVLIDGKTSSDRCLPCFTIGKLVASIGVINHLAGAVTVGERNSIAESGICIADRITRIDIHIFRSSSLNSSGILPNGSVLAQSDLASNSCLAGFK